MESNARGSISKYYTRTTQQLVIRLSDVNDNSNEHTEVTTCLKFCDVI
jgi:hypothetical protein